MATAALKRRQLLLFSSRGVAANRFQFRLGNEESQRGDPIQEDDCIRLSEKRKSTGNVKLLTIPPASVHASVQPATKFGLAFSQIGVQNADGYTDAHGVECYVKRMFQA
jgi:hypothetical protein